MRLNLLGRLKVANEENQNDPRFQWGVQSLGPGLDALIHSINLVNLLAGINLTANSALGIVLSVMTASY